MTEEELKAHMALNDARMRVVRGEYVSPEEYTAIVSSIRAGHEAKLAAQASAAKQKATARRAAGKPDKLEQAASLLDMLRASAEAAQ